MPQNNGRRPGPPKDPRELAEEIEQTRADMGETVESLAERANPRRLAWQQGGEVAERARARLSEGSAALRHAGAQVRDRLAERAGWSGGGLGEAVPDRAEGAIRQVAATVRRNRRQVAGAVAGLLAARWLIRRRRRRAARRGAETG